MKSENEVWLHSREVYNPFVDPRVFNTLRWGEKPYLEAKATDTTHIECCSSSYVLKHPEAFTLVPGETIYLRLSFITRNFYIQLPGEYEEEQAPLRKGEQQSTLKALQATWRNRPEEER